MPNIFFFLWIFRFYRRCRRKRSTHNSLCVFCLFPFSQCIFNSLATLIFFPLFFFVCVSVFFPVQNVMFDWLSGFETWTAHPDQSSFWCCAFFYYCRHLKKSAKIISIRICRSLFSFRYQLKQAFWCFYFVTSLPSLYLYYVHELRFVFE